METPCRRASEIDLGRFVIEPQAAEWEDFRQHYPTCAACTASLAAWTRLEYQLRAIGEPPFAGHPAADALLTYQQHPDEIAPTQRQAMATHLRGCPQCRYELRALSTFDLSRVRRWVAEAVEPAPTASPVLQSSAPSSAQSSLSLVVLRLARRGLEVVEQTLVEPLRDLFLEPVAAVTRGAPAAPAEHALTFRLEAGDMSVHVAAAPREEGLALTLTFYGAGREVLTGTRVTIRQNGRAVLSAKTDGQGQVKAPHLAPGVYEVACREPQVAFRLEVREESPVAVVTTEPHD
jgi:hypothetical protein